MSIDSDGQLTIDDLHDLNDGSASREAVLDGGARYGRSAEPREREREREHPPQREPANHCQHCDAPVSREFRRVFGIGEDDLVWGCLECFSASAVKRGATKPWNDGEVGVDISAGSAIGGGSDE